MTEIIPTRRIRTRVITYFSGTIFLICILAIVADITLILILRLENANNAWYFPYSIFTLPFLLVSGPVFLYGVRKLRRGSHGTDDASLEEK